MIITHFLGKDLGPRSLGVYLYVTTGDKVNTVINLKTILNEIRNPADLASTNGDVLGWKNFWFSRVRNQLNQAVHNWNRDGVISDDTLDDYVKMIDDMGELFKSTARQTNRLMGGGFGPKDFTDGP